jgi:hypothetical protein
MENQDLRRIEELVARVQALTDPQAREVTIELLRAVMDLHASALERMLTIANDHVEAIAADHLCSAVLLLHGLHPDDFETRVARAVEFVQRRLGPSGATIALLGIEDGAVRLRYEGSSAHSAAGVREAVEQYLYTAAPEIEAITIEGLREPADGFVPLEDLVSGITK